MEYPQYDYAVIGGDMRQVYLTEELAKCQNQVCHYALMAVPDMHKSSCTSSIVSGRSLTESCKNARCIIGPVPLSQKVAELNQQILKDSLYLKTLLEDLQPGQYFFAGCIPQDFQRKAEEKGVFVFDLMKEDSLSVSNSIATAEGALCEAIKRSPRNLRNSSCAVLGYGKCGSTLVHYLKGISCNVSVFTDPAIERSFASITADNCGTLKDFQMKAKEFAFIFNTIPAAVVTDQIMRHMNHSTVIIDIASAPGGVDYEAAKKHSVKAFHCLGLPGKYAPYSSAKAIKETIEAILSRERST